jgi:hypothetical protein
MRSKSRPILLQIPLNDAERDELRAAAARHTLSMATYARVVLLAAMRRELKLGPRNEPHLRILEEASSLA